MAVRSFFTTHSIIFLGGENSKNFKIMPEDPTIVLKVENLAAKTPLALATEAQNLEALQTLIQNGADALCQ